MYQWSYNGNLFMVNHQTINWANRYYYMENEFLDLFYTNVRFCWQENVQIVIYVSDDSGLVWSM